MSPISIQNLDSSHLEKTSREFFSAYGVPKLLGRNFIETLCKNEKEGYDLFDSLMNQCGFQNDPEGFFKAVFECIGSGEKKGVQLNDICLPMMYIYHLLEIAFPGQRLHRVKTITQLEQKAHVTPEDPSRLQTVMELFPVRLSDHVIRQSLVSSAVAKQYLPFAEELDGSGQTITFDGHFKNGVVEQMYQNRVIFLLDMHCPVYCRFCFRKHKSKRKEKTPEAKDVEVAVDYVRTHPAIQEILITGGEPLWNKPNMETALNGLMDISHVNTIRIATRSIVYYPELFLKNNGHYIWYLIEKNKQCQKYGKRIELGIHVLHPDEISIQSLNIISRLVENGIQVYVQTPFLGGVNTKGRTLGRLFSLLRQVGAQIYYIFTPCHTIYGTKSYWTPIQNSFEAQMYLRDHFSDRLVPKMCTATALGKVEWHTSGWAVEKDKKDPEYTWIRTPYTLEYFKQFIRDIKEMPDFRENNEGTLDAKFRLDMGDEKLLSGNRKGSKPEKRKKHQADVSKVLPRIFKRLYEVFELGPSIAPVPSSSMSRVHKTRLEVKMGDFKECEKYFSENRDITDVVVLWDGDPASSLKQVCTLLERLRKVSHIECVRLRCPHLCTQPEKFTKTVIEALSKYSDFSLSHLFRIEVETWFLVSDQITDTHKEAVNQFLNRGVNVYANSALMEDVNDNPEAIVALALSLRKAKIEFHHLYASGLCIQKEFGYTLDHQAVISIASHVRTQCSGRQIPLYMIQTSEGDIDFGMAPCSLEQPCFIPFSP